MDRRWIKSRIKEGEYSLCLAAELERQAEKISLAILEKTLIEGKILQKFSKDTRGESFLVGTEGRKPLHVMCAAAGKNFLRVLAIYYPRHPKWVMTRPQYYRRMKP